MSIHSGIKSREGNIENYWFHCLNEETNEFGLRLREQSVGREFERKFKVWKGCFRQ